VLLVSAGDLLDAPVLERAPDELVEPVAVPLLEGGAVSTPYTIRSRTTTHMAARMNG
jgi:hypothetical protein